MEFFTLLLSTLNEELTRIDKNIYVDHPDFLSVTDNNQTLSDIFKYFESYHLQKGNSIITDLF